MTYVEDSNVEKSYYDILKVESTATEADIKTAYRQLLLSTHPDKTGKSTSTEVQITLIKEAYKTLVDAQLRKNYDNSLAESTKRHGFNLNGDGLDTYGLHDFEEEESGDEMKWSKMCPRCQIPSGMVLTEENLSQNGTDDGNGGFDIIVQCSSCSLWIKVKYYEDVDEEEQE
ncbi:J protein type 3 [Scheffersomyces xylosifermentans]|uniref:J protein type 3 n=1 Tax=Scheffersomyces xylosifermentans TaxID=1304137 RepID=UPI00315D178F